MRRFFPILVLLVIVGFTTTASGKGKTFSALSGGNIGLDDHMLSALIGFPGLEVAYHRAIDTGFEVAPKLQLFFGRDTRIPEVGAHLGSDLRYTVMTDGAWRVNLFAEPAVSLFFEPTFKLGLRVGGPGLQVAYNVLDGAYLVFGARLSPMFGYGADTEFFLTMPMLLEAGGEFSLTERVNLTLRLEFGPDLMAGTFQDAEVSFYMTAMFGVVVKL